MQMRTCWNKGQMSYISNFWPICSITLVINTCRWSQSECVVLSRCSEWFGGSETVLVPLLLMAHFPVSSSPIQSPTDWSTGTSSAHTRGCTHTQLHTWVFANSVEYAAIGPCNICVCVYVWQQRIGGGHSHWAVGVGKKESPTHDTGKAAGEEKIYTYSSPQEADNHPVLHNQTMFLDVNEAMNPPWHQQCITCTHGSSRAFRDWCIL